MVVVLLINIQLTKVNRVVDLIPNFITFFFRIIQHRISILQSYVKGSAFQYISTEIIITRSFTRSSVVELYNIIQSIYPSKMRKKSHQLM